MESEAAPYMGMLMAECCQVGVMIISKQALSTAMTTFVFVSYSNALASLILLPFSFFHHRYMAQLSGYTGINYSSPTLGAAMLNLIPGLTFMLAIIFSLLGVIIIVLGLYSFMWGKAKDEKKSHANQFSSSLSSTQKAALLGFHAEE